MTDGLPTKYSVQPFCGNLHNASLTQHFIACFAQKCITMTNDSDDEFDLTLLPGKMNRLDETASGSFSPRLPVHNKLDCPNFGLSKLDCPNCGLSKLWTLKALDSPNWSALQTLDQIGH